MSFPYKDNTNTGGECICFTCKHKCAWNIKHEAVLCHIDNQIHEKVGICNKYQERSKNNG